MNLYLGCDHMKWAIPAGNVLRLIVFLHKTIILTSKVIIIIYEKILPSPPHIIYPLDIFTFTKTSLKVDYGM